MRRLFGPAPCRIPLSCLAKRKTELGWGFAPSFQAQRRSPLGCSKMSKSGTLLGWLSQTHPNKNWFERGGAVVCFGNTGFRMRPEAYPDRQHCDEDLRAPEEGRGARRVNALKSLGKRFPLPKPAQGKMGPIRRKVVM